VSSSGVRSIRPRNDPEITKTRPKALEARAAQDGLLPTEEQMAAPEKAKRHKEAHGERSRATAPVIRAARTLATRAR